MTLEHSPTYRREQPETNSIESYANETEKLAPKFERVEDAVYQVLTNHRIQGVDRVKLFRKIIGEISKRKLRINNDLKILSEVLKEDARRDSIAHQLRQPPETYNTEAEEKTRKPLD